MSDNLRMAVTGEEISPLMPTNCPFSKCNFTVSSPVLVTCVGQADSGKYPLEVNVSFPPTDVPQSPLLIEYADFVQSRTTPLALR